MVYGDGSGRIFQIGGLTRAVDVIAHELTHGITELTAALIYSKQPGALNESFSDVFGSLVKQFTLNQTAAEADWLIGEGILVPELGTALRSMINPGTAYSGDQQPGHMDHYKDLPDNNDPRNDNGGVHINSGIPNHAFALAARAMGGYAWEKAGKIWYTVLTTRLRANSHLTRPPEPQSMSPEPCSVPPSRTWSTTRGNRWEYFHEVDHLSRWRIRGHGGPHRTRRQIPAT